MGKIAIFLILSLQIAPGWAGNGHNAIRTLRDLSSQFLLSERGGGIIYPVSGVHSELKRRVSYEIGQVRFKWDAGNHCFIVKLPTNLEVISLKPIVMRPDPGKETLLSKMSEKTIRALLLGFD